MAPGTLNPTAAGADAKRVIAGNVDPSTGNIDHAGHLNIAGEVCDLFEVRANGDVRIGGVVGAATVHAGGTLLCGGGISGKGRAVCTAGGDLVSRHISSATVEAHGRIATAGTIFEAKLCCTEDLDTKTGTISAGTVTVAGNIRCGGLGMPSGAVTTVEVGVDEFIRREVVRVKPEVAKLRKREEQIKTVMDPLLQRAKALTAKEREQSMELSYEADEVRETLEKLTGHLVAACKAAAAHPPREIHVAGTIHPNVTIRFGRWQAITTAPFTGKLLKVQLRKVGVTTMQIFVVDEEEKTSTPLTTKQHTDPAFEGVDWLPKM